MAHSPVTLTRICALCVQNDMKTLTLRALLHSGLLLLLAVPLFAQSAPPQAPPLPQQDIVFVIDNSSSMELPPQPSDPLRLRGVAASLILDAVQLTSTVQAGLVFFSDAATTDHQLHEPDLIRQRLQAARLPDADGGTNMEDGLAQAIAMLSSSTAPTRRIVLITDGMPNSPQEKTIPANLVPHAKLAGIEIFAIGLSDHINESFLDGLTRSTGGRTLMCKRPDQLLSSAKKLVGDLDNVYNIANRPLSSSEMTYRFDIPAGVDRARITAILDQPHAFATSEIEFRLAGPDEGEPHQYVVRAGGADRVAAWTAFFSAAGTYTLQIAVHKPGVAGHLGLQLFVEALSNLRANLSVNPPSKRYVFGDEVSIDAQPGSSTGTIAPADVQVTGTVQTPSGGTIGIAFNGTKGKFRVPDVPGRHKVVVKVSTKLAQTQASFDYEAISLPVELHTQPDRLTFSASPLGPAHAEVEDSFTLQAIFSSEVTHPKPVRVSFTFTPPVGTSEIVLDGSTVVRPGTTEYLVPPQGMQVTLRIRMDPKRPLPPTGGKFSGAILIFSKDAGELQVPFELTVQIPKFELRRRLDAFSLWWDPQRDRSVSLGRVHTDLTEDSTFRVTLPEALYSPKGAKLVTLAIRSGKRTPEPQRIEAGKLQYGPIDLPAGDDVPLELVVTPVLRNWQDVEASSQRVPIQLVSSLGMKEEAKPVYASLGGPAFELPFFGTLSRHGRHIATLLVLLLASLIAVMLLVQRAKLVKRFWSFRPGSMLRLGFGPIQIAGPDVEGGAALILPNSGSPIDDFTIGDVIRDGSGQRIEKGSGFIAAPARRLRTGDQISVIHAPDPDEPEDTEPLWELEYLDFDPREGGEVEVRQSAGAWTIGRLLRSSILALITLFVIRYLLATGWLSDAVYHLWFIESIYAR